MQHLPATHAGLEIAGRIQPPGFLEGGDFFPAGRDLALLGIGLRSNYDAAKQLMEADVLGTTRFAVVRDDFEQHQDRMHLDCCFSILTHDCCLMLEEMMGEGSATRRLVDLWIRDRRTGKYKLDKEGIEFSKFMTVRTACCVLCQGGLHSAPCCRGVRARAGRRRRKRIGRVCERPPALADAA